MKQTLADVIAKNKNGLFLLDTPTGFGKTTAVLDIVEDFLCNKNNYKNIKKIFFITNLKTNLPFENLINKLQPDLKNKCLWATATAEGFIKNFHNAQVSNNEIMESKEYKTLKNDIDAYIDVKDKNESKSAQKSLYDKISTTSEPRFRQFIKNKFLRNVSPVNKTKFIKDNAWLTILYPIINIEKYDVIFMTTTKFMLPIDTFKRKSFLLFNDDIINDSVVFIDEFDSTKKIILDRIIEEGLNNSIDIVKLFFNIHLALQNIKIPSKLLNVTEYHMNRQEEVGWRTAEEIFAFQRERFSKIVEQYNLDYIMKSDGFEYKQLFLFDDGKHFTINKDNSKKFLYANVNKQNNQLNIYGNQYYDEDKKLFNYVIQDIENNVDNFAKSIFYLSNNYFYYKNSQKKGYETQYTKEEAIYTVLDCINLSENEKDYLFKKITQQPLIFEKMEDIEDIRKGFNFTEIEDSTYHEEKSIARAYHFPTTPEDVIISTAKRGLLIGISATAKIPTCIGNFDLKYLKSKLKDSYIKFHEEDKLRLKHSFNQMKAVTKDKINIHTQIIDVLDEFALEGKCCEIIHQMFDGEKKEKYEKLLKSGVVDNYYFYIELKLAYLYMQVGTKNIYSYLAFLNSFPTSNSKKLNKERIEELFKDVAEQKGFIYFGYEIMKSDGFDSDLKKVHLKLENGEKVFVITTYQTIGSGKNIQYPIPTHRNNDVVCEENDVYKCKDFDGIYLSTPTNLLQILNFKSESKYKDLSKYVFQQEYLYKNKMLDYYKVRNNIINAFRSVFYGEKNNRYMANPDADFHTLQIIIQAVGRICRCRTKNKDVYIHADLEVVERIKTAFKDITSDVFNDEFIALLDIKIDNKLKEFYSAFTQQSKETFSSLTRLAWQLKNNSKNIVKWKDLREYVLINPTTNNPLAEYKKYYWDFADKHQRYSYQEDFKYNILKVSLDQRSEMKEVSESAADLPLMLQFPYIETMFKEKDFATSFNKARYIMNPSLFKQIYLGAVGEVVGKCILEKEIGYDLEEIKDESQFEMFDYKYKNVYIDFKNWNSFVTDNDKYVRKVANKLNKVKGEKCFVINIIKRGDSKPKININSDVIQIPYLIDPETNTINIEGINYISEQII